MPTELPQANPALVAEINEQILQDYLEIDEHGRFLNPPADDDELHEFIRLSIKVTVPRVVITPGHRAPFEFIADMFFERVDNTLVFANRNGGKTYAIAILNLLDMLFKPGCEIASAGAVKDQAKKCYAYVQEFMEEDWFRDFCHRYLRKTGRTFVTKEIQEETSFRTKSKLQILTATKKGVRGPHPNKARLDEIDEVEWDILQAFFSMARSSNEIKAQNLFSSTRQYERGTMQRLLDEAAKKGITVYEWNIWETVEKCTRRCFDDPEHGTCPIYVHCRGKAHKSDGFYDINDFINKAKSLDPETWDTEWLNKKPAKHKLVYGDAWSESRHIMTPEKLKKLTGIPFVVVDWPRICGIDFGGGPGHPFVYLKLCQLPNGAWLLFFEYVAEQRLMRDHAAVIKASPWWHRHEWSYSDHARQDRMELKDLGVNTKAANKEVKMGINHLRTLLLGHPPNLEPMLYVWHQCTYTIQEFGLYSWPVGPDGTVAKDGNPEKKHDHTMDALRYALYSLKEKPKRRYRTRKMPGV